MINVFYRDSHLGSRMSGPKKVIENLIRSLEDTDTPFALNQEKYSNNIFLHWDTYHLEKYHNLKNKEKLLVGPQVWPFDPNFQNLTEYGKILTPSTWVENLYNKHFPDIKTLVWPVAIYAPEIEDNIKYDCFIYFKSRPRNHLVYMINLLRRYGLTYMMLEYGNYTQDEFKTALSSCKFCVIIDNTESQGIAIQEMMSVNKPLFVCDKNVWDHMGEEYAVPASSIPYWSPECGEYVESSEEIIETFEKFYSNLDSYTPRDFIQRELSPQKTIQILLDYYGS